MTATAYRGATPLRVRRSLTLPQNLVLGARAQVQPIFFNRELVLFAARLQDYSHRLSRLVSLTPSQVCCMHNRRK